MIRWKWLARGYLAALAAAAATVVLMPIAFRNAAVVREQEPVLWKPLARGEIDGERFLSQIPHSSDQGQIYEVEPSRRYAAALLAGRGNCSDMAWGAAWWLKQHGVDYAIVHIVPPNGLLDGKGHTVLFVRSRIGSEVKEAILDVVGRGYPTSAGRPLAVQALTRGALPQVGFRTFDPAIRSTIGYYGAYLDDATLGFIPGAEANRYLSFMHAIIVPLGSKRLERDLYQLVAVLSGTYPTIYVRSLADVFGERLYLRYTLLLCLWLLRSAVVVVPALALVRSVGPRRGARAPRK